MTNYGDIQQYESNENKNEYIFKKNHRNVSTTDKLYTYASEIFHSRLGNSLDLPCAQNTLATLTTKDKIHYGVSSKNFLKKDESLIPLYIYVPVLYNSKYLEYCQNFQFVDLSDLTHITANTTQFAKGLAENFLMSHVSQNFDMLELNNLGVTFPTQTMAPSFDFEYAKSFYQTEVDEYLLHPQNVDFLKKSQPQLVESFLDNVGTTRKKLRDICDLTPMTKFWEDAEQNAGDESQQQFSSTSPMQHRYRPLSPMAKLTRLSEKIRTEYTARLERLDNQLGG